MEKKKTDRANLENFTKLFRLLGLVLTLATVYAALQYKDYSSPKNNLIFVASNNIDEEKEIIEIVIEHEAPPPKSAQVPEIIEIIEDIEDVEETIVESTETDEFDKIEVEDIVEVEVEEEIIEDIPFAIIEEIPIYPGCEKEKGREAKRNCLNRKLQKHVAKYFDVSLASKLGMATGKIKIYIQFKITKTGFIEIIGARAPHIRLESEAREVVNLIPKITPGRQRGIPVNVSYMLPISFEIR